MSAEESEHTAPTDIGVEGETFEGPVDTDGSVLRRAISSKIKQDVDANDVLQGAEGSSVGGDVIDAHNVLEGAENSSVEGDVDANHVLQGAENSSVVGDVDARNVLQGAENSSVEGDVNALHVLRKAENSSVGGDVDARNVLQGAENSSVEGDVDANSVLRNAEDSSVVGDVDAYFILGGAEDSSVEGDVIDANSVLRKAGNSYILSEEVSARSIGLEALGGLLASKELDADDIGDGITVIAQEDESEALTYEGDWDRLSGFLSEELEKEGFGELRGLELFNLDGDRSSEDSGRIGGLEEFRQELEELNSMYDKVKDNFEDYRNWKEEVDLEDIWSKKQEDKKEYLQETDEEIVDTVSDELSVDDEAAEIIFDSNNAPAVLSDIKDFSPDDGEVEDFIQKYNGGVGDAYERKYHLELSDNVNDENIEDLNEELVEQSQSLLEDVIEGEAGYDIDEDLDSYRENVSDLIERKQELGEKIGKLFRGGNREQAEEKINEKQELEKEIREEKEEIVSEAVEDMVDDLENPSTEELKEGLNQLSQHYLGGKARKKAKKISKDLVVGGEELESDSILEVNRWREDISNIPTYEETQCCAMPGFGKGEVFNYMQSDSVDILEFEIGDKYGIGITAYGENERGEDVMLVDSVETPSSILAREDVSEKLSEAIEDYAREQGCSEVIYNGEPFNSAPREFYDNLGGDQFEQSNNETIDVEDGEELYLETDLKSLNGKKARLS